MSNQQPSDTGDTRQHCEHECVCSPHRMIVGHTYGTDDYACVKQNCEHDTRRSLPTASQPTTEHKTWESCHKRFACPDGEECWYASEDYYWDCGKGASKLTDAFVRGKQAGKEEASATIRNEVLDDICKNCGAKEYGACVSTDCPVGSYKSTPGTADKGGE